MKATAFLKPSGDELDRLVKDESRQDTYTAALALIEEALCKFSPSRIGPQFQEEAFGMQRLSEITSPIGGISGLVPGDLIQNNIVENLGSPWKSKPEPGPTEESPGGRPFARRLSSSSIRWKTPTETS